MLRDASLRTLGTTEHHETKTDCIRLPGLSALAACLLAEIHGRSGHFPTIVNLRPAPDPALAVTVFEVAELVNLQAIRDESRRIREE